VTRHQFDNGLSLLLYPTDATEKIALVVLYAVGEDHEPPGKNGLAHLTEHVYVTAAAGDAQARTVQEFTRAYPDGWNAQTGSDYTVFATLFPRERLEDEVRDAATRMGDLHIEIADLQREKLRLLSELSNMYGGTPQLACLNYARAALHPLPDSHRKGGSPEHVARMTVDDVVQWWQRYYKPANATVVLAGAFSPEVAYSLVAKYVASIPRGEIPAARHAATKPKLGQAEAVMIEPTVPNAQAHACLAFAAPRPGDEHYPACLVIASRMWMRAASTNGRVQFTFSVLDDPSLIAVSEPVAASETNDVVLAELRAFVDQAIGSSLQPFEKLATKKNVGALLGLVDYPELMTRNNLYGVAFSIGRREQLALDSAALSQELQGLTDADLEAAARAVFSHARQAGVVVRPR